MGHEIGFFHNYSVLVNRQHPYVEEDYKNRELIRTTDILGESILVEKETYSHYLAFRQALNQEGIPVELSSAYRTLEDQELVMEELRGTYPEEIFYLKVALPGYSEHHTGLALDITISTKEEWLNVDNIEYSEEDMEKRQVKYDKMKEICSQYGFILRYPKGKEEITGYSYEPWHFRYVGEDMAKKIMMDNITLEEYLEQRGME